MGWSRAAGYELFVSRSFRWRKGVSKILVDRLSSEFAQPKVGGTLHDVVIGSRPGRTRMNG